jgi:hypothetical protein
VPEKFTSPEEELAYLRERVKSKERELNVDAAEDEDRDNRLPVVRALPVIAASVPVEAEFAVKLKIPVPV